MKKKLLLFVLVLALLPFFVAAAQQPAFEGEVSAGGVLPQVKGNTGKFNEYRDLKPGAVSPYGDITLKYDDEKGAHVDLDARNPARSPTLPGMGPTDD